MASPTSIGHALGTELRVEVVCDCAHEGCLLAYICKKGAPEHGSWEACPQSQVSLLGSGLNAGQQGCITERHSQGVGPPSRPPIVFVSCKVV